MSQASEYAGAVEEAHRCRPREFVCRSLKAGVSDQGHLTLKLHTAGLVTADEALDLAAYIFEVIGERPAFQEWQRTDEEEVPF